MLWRDLLHRFFHLPDDSFSRSASSKALCSETDRLRLRSIVAFSLSSFGSWYCAGLGSLPHEPGLAAAGQAP